MTNNSNNGTSKTSMTMLIIYLISSLLGGLIFSGLALRSKNNGGSGIGWAILSLLFIAIFGCLGYAYYYTSSPTRDPFWYYLGITTLVANSLALFIVFVVIFKRK